MMMETTCNEYSGGQHYNHLHSNNNNNNSIYDPLGNASSARVSAGGEPPPINNTNNDDNNINNNSNNNGNVNTDVNNDNITNNTSGSCSSSIVAPIAPLVVDRYHRQPLSSSPPATVPTTIPTTAATLTATPTTTTASTTHHHSSSGGHHHHPFAATSSVVGATSTATATVYPIQQPRPTTTTTTANHHPLHNSQHHHHLHNQQQQQSHHQQQQQLLQQNNYGDYSEFTVYHPLQHQQQQSQNYLQYNDQNVLCNVSGSTSHHHAGDESSQLIKSATAAAPDPSSLYLSGHLHQLQHQDKGLLAYSGQSPSPNYNNNSNSNSSSSCLQLQSAESHSGAANGPSDNGQLSANANASAAARNTQYNLNEAAQVPYGLLLQAPPAIDGNASLQNIVDYHQHQQLQTGGGLKQQQQQQQQQQQLYSSTSPIISNTINSNSSNINSNNTSTPPFYYSPIGHHQGGYGGSGTNNNQQLQQQSGQNASQAGYNGLNAAAAAASLSGNKVMSDNTTSPLTTAMDYSTTEHHHSHHQSQQHHHQHMVVGHQRTTLMDLSGATTAGVKSNQTAPSASYYYHHQHQKGTVSKQNRSASYEEASLQAIDAGSSYSGYPTAALAMMKPAHHQMPSQLPHQQQQQQQQYMSAGQTGRSHYANHHHQHYSQPPAGPRDPKMYRRSGGNYQPPSALYPPPATGNKNEASAKPPHPSYNQFGHPYTSDPMMAKQLRLPTNYANYLPPQQQHIQPTMSTSSSVHGHHNHQYQYQQQQQQQQQHYAMESMYDLEAAIQVPAKKSHGAKSSSSASNAGKYYYPAAQPAAAHPYDDYRLLNNGMMVGHHQKPPINAQYAAAAAAASNNANNRGNCSYYPNAYYHTTSGGGGGGYPMGYGGASSHQRTYNGGGTNGGYYPNGVAAPMPLPGSPSPFAQDYYYAQSYLKAPPHASPKQPPPPQLQDPLVDSSQFAASKYSRNCYYDSAVAQQQQQQQAPVLPLPLPMAGEKSYGDLEEQINCSKIPKLLRNGPAYLDYHHQHPQQMYQMQQQQQQQLQQQQLHHQSYSTGKYYPNDRYLYHGGHPQQSPYYPGMHYPIGGVGGTATAALVGHQSSGHLMATTDMAVDAKKINLREFLTSWNDDEEEQLGGGQQHSLGDEFQFAGGGGGGQAAATTTATMDNVFMAAKPSEGTHRIQVGISIDKTNLGDKSGPINLPDIIIDIGKQKATMAADIPELSQSSGLTNCPSKPTSEKLYVLESIDVPLSELNKYKHLSVINKLPDNIVHMNDRHDTDNSNNDAATSFNETPLPPQLPPPDGGGGGGGIKLEQDTKVENSMKFIEEIESNHDFKNDFELNVDYESYPDETRLRSPVERKYSAVLDEVEATTTDSAGGVCGTDRKESVIVAHGSTEAGIRRKSYKSRKRHRAVVREEEVESAVDSDDDEACHRRRMQFKSLIKCCLDVINTKEYRRNAKQFLSVPVPEQVPELERTESRRPAEYKYLRRKVCQRRETALTLKALCEARVLEEADRLEAVVPVPVLHPTTRDVPRLRDLCEDVLKLNNYIIDVDDLSSCQMVAKDDDHQLVLLDANNNDHNQFCLMFDTADDYGGGGLVPVVETASNSSPTTCELAVTPEETIDDSRLPEGSNCYNSPSNDDDNNTVIEVEPPGSVVFCGDSLVNYDYFLEEAANQPIQFCEEIVPADLNRHRCEQLTEWLRAKYVQKANLQAADLRRMLIRKYQYHQKPLTMGRSHEQRSNRAGNLYSQLCRKYERLQRLRRRVCRRSKSVAVQGNDPIVLMRPMPVAVSVGESDSSRTIVPLISESVQESVEQMVYQLTRDHVERPVVTCSMFDKNVNSRLSDNSRSGSGSGSGSGSSSSNCSDSSSSASGSGSSTSSSSECADSDSASKLRAEPKRKLKRRRHSDEPTVPVQSDSRPEPVPRPRIVSESVVSSVADRVSHRTEASRRRSKELLNKKVKPKFEDILLGIDNIYMNASAKVKPRLTKAHFKSFDVAAEELSAGSPSSETTTTSSRSSGSRSSSGRSPASAGASKLTSASKTGSSAKPSRKRPAESNGELPRKRSHQIAALNGVKSMASSSSKLSKTDSASMDVDKQKLLTKKAVVQLERDRYIDKLGKLFT